MNIRRVSELLEQIFRASLEYGGATEARLTISLEDGSQVLFECNRKWDRQDRVVFPSTPAHAEAVEKVAREVVDMLTPEMRGLQLSERSRRDL